MNRFVSSLTDIIEDRLFLLYDRLSKRQKKRGFGRPDRILGEIMYGIEHSIEVIPHILLYGHCREFADEFDDEEWTFRCMEGRQCFGLVLKHKFFPKGISKEEYKLEEEVIKSMKYFVGNCSVYEDMKAKSHRQFDLQRWKTPSKYDLPFLLDPSDIAKDQLFERFEFLINVCENCPLRL